MRTDHQANEELQIFKKFVSVYPDKINEETIKNIDSPYPDIFCETQSGQKLYFELTECVVESIAKSTGDLIKESRSQNRGEVISGQVTAFTEDALFEKSMGKFKKTYEKMNADDSIELVSYFNQQIEPLSDVLLQYKSFVELNISSSPFKRVWVYSVYQNEVLSMYSF